MKPYVMKSVKKTPWPVTLPDGTKVTLLPPKMGLLARVTGGDEMNSPKAQLGLVAELLSSNLERKKFNADYVGKVFDYADMEEFMTHYYEYINGFGNQKN